MPGKLNALKIDAPSLFSLFSSSKRYKNLDIYGFDDQVLVSRQIATENKDAVFSSFFDLSAIRKFSSSYGLDFAHYMVLLPGSKTIRLIGNLIKHTPSFTCEPIDSTKKAHI
ncbi:uncharacterized protein EV154DRAFT_416189 [Mucor mucedo]|uniref:uncharacterized protein n=1 Tax=Mucor mucedo TaxID=29922 RepID=UPI00221FB890|nr:uncharacterized protein EV154DRAFT_416189 [Mucor mucedo]KAI7893825.1 hypothetical protein EV154DRAFT_416189 [Mucor mucedo]